MKKAKIIVLSGQSNAVGVGHVACLGKHFSDEKIQEYRNGYENIRINYYSHDKKSDGFGATTLNCTEVRKDTLGPEVGMAEYLTDRFPDEEFFIVKFAVGGASLFRDFLSPSGGGYYDVDSFASEYRQLLHAYFTGAPIKAGWCYNGLLHILRDSIDRLKENGYAPEIIGFCWMQGEKDAATPENTAAYSLRFDNFINDFKQEFSQYLNHCTFVDAGVADVWKYHKEMNAIKKEYAHTHENFVYVDTIENGLTTKYEPFDAPDTFHFDSGSVIALGHLFAQAVIDHADM